MTGLSIILIIVALYFLLTLAVGYFSYRRTTGTAEDYFMASREFGTIVLLMAIFATNMTAFIMVGMPGTAYHTGIGVFGWGIIFSCLYPLFIFFLGYRAWLLGKKYGYMTPSELYSDRYESHAVNIIMFILLVYYTIPYLVLGVIGGGIAFASMTNGAIPYWLGGLIVILVTFIYTFLGGMRGTAWTNVLQGFVFILAAWVAVILIAYSQGGFESITQKVLSAKPKLLQRSGIPMFSYKMWFSAMLIFCSPIGYPHLWVRLLTGKTHKTLQRINVLYPFAAVSFWLPSIIVGVWGAALIPGLVGMKSDTIFPMMVVKFTNPLVTGLILAGLFAAIMSSLDGMILTISTMFTRDILGKYKPSLIEGKEVTTGKLFIIVITIITYILGLIRPGTIVGIAAYAFSGYVLLIPIMVAGLYWRRSTKHGAVAAMILGTAILFLLQFKILPPSLNFGFMPIFPSLVVTIVVLIVISYLTQPPTQKTIDKFQGLFDVALK
jgi:SSS family solute:Na+ symporter